MQKAQKDTDAALKKILKPEQITRLGEIELRQQGPTAILRRADIAKKLGISDEQMEMLQGVQEEMRSAQGEMRGQQREAMRAIQDQMQATLGGGNQADANANGGGGGGGGRRGGNNGPGNREAMQKYLESNPEAKAQMDQFTKQGDALKNQTFAAIGQVLSKAQKNKFDKMLGKPFDIAKLTNPGAPGAPPADAAAKTDEPEKKTAAKGTAKKTTTKKSTTKKKSAA